MNYMFRQFGFGSAYFDVVASGSVAKAASSYTWDAMANLQTATDPRGVTTTNTWNYGNFALGELSSSQQSYVVSGTTKYKSATSFAYYDSGSLDYTNSGLVASITAPQPGTIDALGSGATVETDFIYDSLGNVTSATTPGNDTVSSKTFTFGYTSDGGYSQSDAIGQPITVTDNVGKVTHLRYDSRGNRTSVTDALGNETDTSYNLANQPLTTTLPATGQTGTGHGTITNAYLYVGGPMLSTTTYDESAVQARQVTHTYGQEAEMLTTTGSTEPVAYAYDAAYRVTGLTDGNNHTTNYSYDAIGNMTLAAYPNANSSTGYDETQFSNFDNLGNATKRIDGRGVETDYVCNDPGQRR